MAHEKSSAPRTSDAMAVVPRRSSGDAAAAQVERRTQVDPRTHARSVYQRGQDGSEVYASYYNSNDDPEFQRCHNRDGRGSAFVQSVQFSYVSNGGALPPSQQQQQQQRRRHHRPTSAASPTVVEEDAEVEKVRPVYDYDLGDEHDAHGTAAARTRGARSNTGTTRQPVVEEPDDEVDDDGAERAAHRTTRGQHHRTRDIVAHDAGRAHRGTYAPFAAPDPFGMDAMMSDMMFPSWMNSSPTPFSRAAQAPVRPNQSRGGDAAVASYNNSRARTGAVMGGAFSQDFFGPDSPFRMMEAMEYHMQQQRAAMFGGRDPFANFF